MNTNYMMMLSQNSPKAVISQNGGFVNFNGKILNKGMISEISNVVIFIPSDSNYRSGTTYDLSQLERAVKFTKVVYVKYSVTMGNGNTYNKSVKSVVEDNLEESIQEVKEHYEKFTREL